MSLKFRPSKRRVSALPTFSPEAEKSGEFTSPRESERQINKTNIQRELNEVASKDSKKLKKKKTNIAHSAKRTQLTLKKTRASN